MRRIVVCFDGTWNQVTEPKHVTNVVKLAQAVKAVASDGVSQLVYYNSGVGTGGRVDRLLGGLFGKGIRSNVKRALAFLALNYQAGDEIYIFGFSRGAFSARALAGVVGAGGIPRKIDFEQLEIVWNYYRVAPEVRGVPSMFGMVTPGRGAKASGSDRRAMDAYSKIAVVKPQIRCVGVWDTVGSYGIPAGFGLGAIGRMFATWTRGFHSTRFGATVDIGLHALGLDERRRPFAPTFWTAPVGEEPNPNVEQVWFAGVHSNVGGSYPEAGLSDLALAWMVARVREIGIERFGSGLEFDEAFLGGRIRPSSTGLLVRSERGWPLSTLWPYVRPVLKNRAVKIGVLWNNDDPNERNINERVHWSVLERLDRSGSDIDGRRFTYTPKNIRRKAIETGQIASATVEERRLLAMMGVDLTPEDSKPPSIAA